MSTSTALTEKRDEAERTAPFEAMDRLDEEQIIKDLKGRIITEYFYRFKDKGVEKVGLSFSGVKWMAEQLVSEGRLLSIIHTEIRESADGKSYFADATCQELKTGIKRNGHTQQQKFYKDGSENPFAYTLAGSKSERNAMRHFIPETAIQEGYKEWAKKGGKAVPVGANDITNEAKVSDVKAEAPKAVGTGPPPAGRAIPQPVPVTESELLYVLREMLQTEEGLSLTADWETGTLLVVADGIEGEALKFLKSCIDKYHPRLTMQGSKMTYAMPLKVAES